MDEGGRGAKTSLPRPPGSPHRLPLPPSPSLRDPPSGAATVPPCLDPIFALLPSLPTSPCFSSLHPARHSRRAHHPPNPGRRRILLFTRARVTSIHLHDFVLSFSIFCV